MSAESPLDKLYTTITEFDGDVDILAIRYDLGYTVEGSTYTCPAMGLEMELTGDDALKQFRRRVGKMLSDTGVIADVLPVDGSDELPLRIHVDRLYLVSQADNSASEGV